MITIMEARGKGLGGKASGFIENNPGEVPELYI